MNVQMELNLAQEIIVGTLWAKKQLKKTNYTGFNHAISKNLFLKKNSTACYAQLKDYLEGKKPVENLSQEIWIKKTKKMEKELDFRDLNFFKVHCANDINIYLNTI